MEYFLFLPYPFSNLVSTIYDHVSKSGSQRLLEFMFTKKIMELIQSNISFLLSYFDLHHIYKYFLPCIVPDSLLVFSLSLIRAVVFKVTGHARPYTFIRD